MSTNIDIIYVLVGIFVKLNIHVIGCILLIKLFPHNFYYILKNKMFSAKFSAKIFLCFNYYWRRVNSHKDLERFVKAMYRKLEPFVEVLTYQVLSSSKIASPGQIYLI